MDLRESTIPLLKNTERVLIAFNVLLVGVLFFTVYKNYQETQQLKIQAEDLLPVKSAADQPVVFQDPQPFSTYESQLSKRDLFQAPQPKVVVPEQPVQPVEEQAVQTMEALPEHLKIVGIVVGEPTEVIIEDTKAQQTFFVREGENMGDFAMQRSGEDKIIIKYQGQNFQVPIRQ